MTTKGQLSSLRTSAIREFGHFMWLFVALAMSHPTFAQGDDKQLRSKGDGLFEKGAYFEALPLYSQLVSLSPADHDLNFKLGTCSIYGKEEKAKAVGYLKYAVQGPSTSALAWYFLGRAYQLDYRFDDALEAYRHFSGTADRKMLDAHPVEALQLQCRNAKFLMSNIKDIDVLSRVEVDASDFFRFYDLGNIGGKIVVTPEELLTPFDRKSGERFITYLPDGGGPVYFSSYGKNGSTGRDIYRCELLPGGAFSTPVRLAGYVNTDQDENYAVMGQDRKTFYFCSKGHNSMGGYDVFKCAYDPGMDVFGSPENMDFAVNTPADELLYITDPEGKQACFASDRDSRQGMLSVYRVGTEMAPVSITVLQGVFASAVAPADRQAKIIVEDMLTHERVAEVATDDSGKYLVALPRGGQYRFKVETGATGGRLLATVEVPKTAVAAAYKQEMRVAGAAGDQLELTNHFDTPITGDVLALAMDEIRRRARLDVTGQRMQPLVTTVPVNMGDPLALAGFGSKSLPEVKSLAQEEARQRQQEAGQQKQQADQSYGLALNSVQQAEVSSASAKALVQEAAQVTDPVASERLLYRAALARQEADDANLRAKAAYGTARDLDSTATIASQEAQQAATVANGVEQGIASGNTANLTDALKRLKTAVDARSGPNARLESAERMRREASEATMASGRKVQQALTARQEESDFAERVNAQKRFAEGAKGGKKENAERQLADMQGQLDALHEEADAAFAEARAAEETAAAARGKAELAKYLAENKLPPSAPPASDQVTALATRISRVQSENAGLAIPNEYRPVATETAEQRQKRLFDWGTGNYTADASSSATVAKVAGQNTGGRNTTTTADPASTTSAVPERSNDLADINAGNAPSSGTTVNTDGKTAAQAGNVNDANTPNKAGSTTDVGAASNGDKGAVPTPANQAISTTSTPASMGTSENSIANDPKSANGQEAGRTADGQDITDLDFNVPDTLNDLADADTATEEDPTTGTVEVDGAEEVNKEDVPDMEEQTFFAANALAELQQLRSSAPDRHTRDSLDVAIAEKKSELSALAKGETLATAVKNTDGAATGSSDQAPTEAQEIAQYAGAAEIEAETTVIPKTVGVDDDLAQRAVGTEGAQQPGNTPVGDGASSVATTQRDSLSNSGAMATKPREVGSTVSTSVEVPAKGTTDSVAMAAIRQLPSPMGGNSGNTSTGGADAENAHVTPVAIDSAEIALAKAGSGAEGVPLVVPIGNPMPNVAPSFEMEYEELAFDPALLDPDLAEELVPGILVRYKQAQAAQGNGVGQAAELSRLQQQLLDSVDARSASQSAFLEMRPEATAQILPQLERLRVLKGALQSDPENGLAIAMSTEDVSGTPATSGSRIGPADTSALPLMASSPAASANHATAYVTLAADIDHVYETRITYRATDVGAELAAKDSDVAKIRHLRGEIELLEGVISETPASKAYDKLRADTDRKTDELLILQTDLGQRLDFVSRQEYKAALDSSRTLQGAMSRKGVPQGSPLVEMVKGYEDSAKSAMDEAATYRKQGDRSGKIMDRDSFYRQAWSADIQAFQLMDRSHTVRNYLLQNGVDPNEQLAYEEVVKRLFGEQGPQLAQKNLTGNRSTVSSMNLGETTSSAPIAVVGMPTTNAIPEAAPVEIPSSSPRLESEIVVANAPATPETVAASALASTSVAEPLPAYLEKHYELDTRTKDSLAADAQARVYFMLRGSAMEHADSAKWALADAEEMAAGANALRHSTAIPYQGTASEQAVALQGRSDSLRFVSLKHTHAAALDNAAAEHLISGLSQERSVSITAMEVVNRRATVRVEPLAVALPAPDVEQPRSTAIPVMTAPVETGSSVPVEQPVATAPEVTTEVVEPVIDATLPRILAPLVADNFEVKPAGATRTTPIPVDAPMPQGVVYKVQVGAFRNQLPREAFSDMTPVTGESVGNGLTRYAAGQFTTAQSAAKAGEQVRARGYRDAFVVAYLDGKKVSLRDAMAAERAMASAARVATSRPEIVATTTPVSQGTTDRTPSTAPTVTATAPAEAGGADAVMLAKYPTTVQEVLARFNPNAASTEYYNDPTAAPAKQVETIKGLFFTVQVGVYSKPTALDRLFNIDPLNSERTETGKIRYTTGMFQDPGSATARKNVTVQLGVKDAYVTAYLNGTRIALAEGRALLAKFGPSILADPSLGPR